MAEAVVISLAKSALQQLGSPAIKEFLLLWNSRKELKKLEATIEAISHVLEDAHRKQLTDQLVKGWLIRLRAVMYEADDLFDDLAARALHKKTMGGYPFMKEVRLFFSESNQISLMFKIAHDVKDVRESLDAIAKDMDQFSFIKQPVDDKSVTLLNREPTHSYIKETDVIGRDQDRDQIVDMLLAEDKEEISYHQCVSVVAIIGPGGFGKTTLAQLVHNDERVSAKVGFDLHIWVCVNYFSDLGKVLKEVIASTGKEPQNIALDPLQKQFREIISGKRYLLVLDDVWDDNRDNWQKFKRLLDCGKSGSKVLVTTRYSEVARCLDAVKYHKLGVLDEESALSLFMKMAFCEGELSQNPELVSLGKKIVHKCGRVPLTLTVVGSLLRHKEKDEKIWSEFANNELGEVISDDYDTKVMQVLMASYNDLPPNVKLCFAYCSLFPKDYWFDKDELIRLWLAQGFVMPSANKKQSIEELADIYFFYLVDRCFFEVVHQNSGYLGEKCVVPKIYIAKVHDMLHDLAINVARTDSTMLDEVPNDKQKGGILRHISICSNVDRDYSALVSDPKMLRTLLFPRKQKISKGSLNVLLGSCRMIRTLQLSNMGIAYLPDSVGELIHLRYLDLSGNTKLEALPSSICKLHHLMIFVLRNCSSLVKLPLKIEKLVCLRHLYLYGCPEITSLPSGFASLTSLVHVDRFVVDSHNGGLRYLKYLDNLCGALTIELPEEGWKTAIEDAQESNMSRKHKLNKMVIKWVRRDLGTRSAHEKPDEAKVVLEALQPHENLEYLEIQNYCGNILPSWVCSLQKVKELCLSECGVEYLEEELMHNSLLPLLENLIIRKMKKLKGWWRKIRVDDEDGMSRVSCLPKVKKVVIEYCPLLTERMPLFSQTEQLYLNSVDVKLVELLMLNTKSRLKWLQLGNIEGLSYVPESWLKHLTALQTLEIHDCHDLSRVSCRGLAHLTTLEDLRFISRGAVNFVDDDAVKSHQSGMPWRALRRLRVLAIFARDPDTNIQEGLQYLTSLEELQIGILRPLERRGVDAENRAIEIDEFPAKSLQKLHTLHLYGEKISSCLPKGIECLPSLEDLALRSYEELYLSWTTLLITMKLRDLDFNGVKSVIPAKDIVVEQQSHLRGLSIIQGEKWMHDAPWKMLGSLVTLQLWDLPETEQLPEGIQHLVSLQEFYIQMKMIL